jgi:uncharacterized protein YcfJ
MKPNMTEWRLFVLKTTLKVLATATLLTACSHSLTLSVEAAERVYGKVVGLEPIYKTQTVQTPYQSCNIVQVVTNSNDALLRGAIIGGIIGNSLRGGSRVRNRNAGAIIGAFIGNSQSNGSVVRQENRCRTQYRTTTQEIVHQYWVVINVHGQIIRKAIWANNGQTHLRIGNSIPLDVNYSLNQ